MVRCNAFDAEFARQRDVAAVRRTERRRAGVKCIAVAPHRLHPTTGRIRRFEDVDLPAGLS
jgi:hypothetical protein